MKKLNILLLSATLAFASCADQTEESIIQDYSTYSFGSTINDLATRATSTSFESGDMISVTAYSDAAFTSAIAEDVTYTWNGSMFSSDTPIDVVDQAAFRAVYPYTSGASFQFEIANSQDSHVDYTTSDLMTAETALTSSKSPSLSFYHRLSQVNVSLTGVSSSSSVSVEIASQTLVDCDLAANTYVGTGDISKIYCTTSETDYYSAIVAPQTLPAGTVFATVTVNGEEYEFTLTSDLTLQSGVAYLFEGKITATGELEFTTSINEWEDGGIIEDDDNGGDNGGDDVVTGVLDSGSGYYVMNGLSYFDSEWYDESIVLSLNSTTRVVTISGLFYGNGASVKGVYDSENETVTISDWQNLGTFSFESGDSYDVYLANAYSVSDIVFTLNSEGTAFETTQTWGYYVDGANAWYEVYSQSNINIEVVGDGVDLNGTWSLFGNSYWYDWYEETDITFTHNTSTGDVTVSNMMDGYGSDISGSYNSNSKSISIEDWQYLGTFSFSIGTYDVYFTNNYEDAPVVFSLQDDGTYYTDQEWGYYIEQSDYDTDYYYDIYTESYFSNTASASAASGYSNASQVVISRAASKAKEVAPVTSISLKSSNTIVSNSTASSSSKPAMIGGTPVVLKDIQ